MVSYGGHGAKTPINKYLLATVRSRTIFHCSAIEENDGLLVISWVAPLIYPKNIRFTHSKNMKTEMHAMSMCRDFEVKTYGPIHIDISTHENVCNGIDQALCCLFY
jgi:hypothetical protein